MPIKELRNAQRVRTWRLDRSETAIAWVPPDVTRLEGIPATVARIYGGALRDCRGLVSATLPDKVRQMGPYLFKDQHFLSQVRLPASLERISRALFAGCTSLQEIEIPSSVGLIDREAFAGCTSLQEIRISPGVHVIGREAFSGCALTALSCRLRYRRWRNGRLPAAPLRK